MKSISVNDYCLWGVDGILRQCLQSVCQFSMAPWGQYPGKYMKFWTSEGNINYFRLFLWHDSNSVKTWNVSFCSSNYHPSLPIPWNLKYDFMVRLVPGILLGEVFYGNIVLHHGAGCYIMTWFRMTWQWQSVRTIMLIDECTFSCVEAMPAVALLRGLLQHWGWVRSPIHCIASQHPLLGNPTPPLPDQS